MRVIAALCVLLSSLPVLAQAPSGPLSDPPENAATRDADDAAIVDLDAVVVSGAQPGPGMWKVSRDGRVLWILGTLTPLPKRMQWESREVQSALAQAQELIEAPAYAVTPKIGPLQKLFLLPSAMGARKNPGGATLREVVPAGDYARWQALKARHLGGDRGVEAYRPIFAAGELYREALDDAGLTYRNPVQSRVAGMARKRGVAITRPSVAIELRNPRAALRTFREQPIDDAECFARTLDRVERDLGTMRAQADAWAVGDLDTMRALPAVSAQYEACTDALADAAVARKLGIGDLRTRMRGAWLAAAERALARNDVTVALLPIGELLRPGGAISTLRARGYAVTDPGAHDGLADAIRSDVPLATGRGE
jgi:hypothetical protein